ncbi:5-formyltetrahydrofolate cyclo-ligase [Lederbergia lenta]|uniref:5-formyltetrahydrofolate cyclo-ligase n=1 Tax=Lederbergia lenta TaxID=1467 RepID=A0A2X4YW69_LEDLE|nr:5-formyltetrahydrofolate cyclo-ligase [Lederbergia lenta]MEC2325188.1 5-formyltetrahydrofolate cyclo-ligase [Lederbergia lenta]SQI56055.1 5-formyltetrahydrofolate cyclo-ligase [Lederbergia lenta]
MDKKTLRRKMSDQLQSMDRIAYEHRSYLIASCLTATSEWKNATTIGITMSHFPEVDTWQLIRAGWAMGKRMVIPKCMAVTKEMKFKEITSFDQLEIVYMNLFEPIREQKDIHSKEIDLLIVPGLAFNHRGYRVGFGGGYYDRYLERFQGETISLAFSEQVMEGLPYENHDLPVEKIITDQEIIIC